MMTRAMRVLSFARSVAELFQRVFAPAGRRHGASDALQWDYSCAGDVLSAWIGKPQPCDEVAVDDYIVVHISRETHQPVGIDVLSAAGRSGKWPGALNAAFARALLEEHGAAALTLWRARRGDIAHRTFTSPSGPRSDF
jgi:hypothetical protein